MILVISLCKATLLQNASNKIKIIKKDVFFANDLHVKFKPYLKFNQYRVN